MVDVGPELVDIRLYREAVIGGGGVDVGSELVDIRLYREVCYREAVIGGGGRCRL